jgi:Uncharacterized protein conserved in bacteria (DUF2213)
MQFFAPETIGPNRALTPEGFLLCRNVPLARTGEQLYSNSEIGYDAGPANGTARVQRDDEEVFDPDSIASWNGKPVLNDHPPEGGFVTPDNWRGQEIIGTMLNPRRGEGELDGFLVVDMLIKHRAAIDDIEAGKRELSGGYDCKYEHLGGDRFRQIKIIGNHGALVDKGRCGPRCAIGDSAIIQPDRRPLRSGLRSRSAARSYDMAVITQDRGRAGGQALARRISRIINDAFRAGSTKDEEELDRLRKDAEHEVSMGEEDRRGRDAEIGGESGGLTEGTEGENHLHVHVHPGGATETKSAEGDQGEDPSVKPGPGTSSGAEQSGDIAAIKAEVAEIKDILAELADAESEEVELAGQEGEGEEVADRRRGVHDRRARARDKMRGWRKARDADLVQTLEEDPDARGEKPPGTGPGAESVSGKNPDIIIDRRRRGTKDAMTQDSRGLEESFQEVLSRAEVLCPGVRLPTFDAAVTRENTQKRLCGFRRRTLGEAYATDAGRVAIDSVVGSANFDLRNATCDAVTTLFNSASAVVAAGNSRPSVSFGTGGPARDGTSRSMSEMIADINKKSRERNWTR